MNTNTTYKAHCFCGDVQLELTGAPVVMAYCHCDSCRHWGASPVSAFTLWSPDSVNVTKGQDNIAGYDKNSSQHNGEVLSDRKWCKKCGGHIYTNHPTMGLFDIPSAVIKGLEFNPIFHVHYQESVLPIKDGLPKFKDLPSDAGGSGEQMEE